MKLAMATLSMVLLAACKTSDGSMVQDADPAGSTPPSPTSTSTSAAVANDGMASADVLALQDDVLLKTVDIALKSVDGQCNKAVSVDLDLAWSTRSPQYDGNKSFLSAGTFVCSAVIGGKESATNTVQVPVEMNINGSLQPALAIPTQLTPSVAKYQISVNQGDDYDSAKAQCMTGLNVDELVADWIATAQTVFVYQQGSSGC